MVRVPCMSICCYCLDVVFCFSFVLGLCVAHVLCVLCVVFEFLCAGVCSLLFGVQCCVCLCLCVVCV